MCDIVLLNKILLPLKENLKRKLENEIIDCEESLKVLQAEHFNLECTNLPFTEPTVTTTFNINKIRSDKNGKESQRLKGEYVDKFVSKLCNNNHLWFCCSQYAKPDLKEKNARKLHVWGVWLPVIRRMGVRVTR